MPDSIRHPVLYSLEIILDSGLRRNDGIKLFDAIKSTT